MSKIEDILKGLKSSSVSERAAAASDAFMMFIKEEDAKSPEIEDCRKALVEALKDESPMVRLNALCSLGHLKSNAYVESIAAMVNDDVPEIRKWAMISLGNIRNAESIPTLTKQLRNPNREVRTGARLALDLFESPKTLKASDKKYEPNPAQEELKVRIMDAKSSPLERIQAIHAIAPIADSTGFAVLQYATDSADESVVLSAIEALETFKGNTYLNPCIRDSMLKLIERSTSQNIRYRAINCLEKLSDKKVTHELEMIVVSDDESPKIKLAATEALLMLSAV